MRDVHLTEKSKELYDTDKTAWETVRDSLKDITSRIKRWFGKLSPDSVRGKIGEQMAAKNQEILDRFVAGVRAASENAAYTKNTTDEGGVRFETRETEDGHKYVNIPITDIVGEGITDTDNIGKKARIYLTNRFRGVILPVGKTKAAYVNKGTISEITNPAKYLEDEVYRGKMLAVTELDNLLKSSTYMSWNNDDGRHPGTLRWLKYKTYFLFSDTNGNDQVYSGIISIRRISRGDVLHDITQLKNITNDNIGSSIIKHAAESASDVSNPIISDSSEKGNTSDKKRLEQSRDADYLSAVKRGDMETAQRMVDEAAERAFANSKIRGEDGKLVKVYHGTYADFTVFDKAMGRSSADIQGMFFSPWDIDAGGYGPNVRAFYLNITNPADERTGYKALNAHKSENYVGIKAREDLEKAGYDGVNNSDEEYIDFTSEQIKSADPVTYDDNGEVIPLSQRFNTEKQDIRYQEREDITPSREELDELLQRERKESEERINKLVKKYEGIRKANVTKRNKFRSYLRLDISSTPVILRARQAPPPQINLTQWEYRRGRISWLCQTPFSTENVIVFLRVVWYNKYRLFNRRNSL